MASMIERPRNPGNTHAAMNSRPTISVAHAPSIVSTTMAAPNVPRPITPVSDCGRSQIELTLHAEPDEQGEAQHHDGCTDRTSREPLSPRIAASIPIAISAPPAPAKAMDSRGAGRVRASAPSESRNGAATMQRFGRGSDHCRCRRRERHHCGVTHRVDGRGAARGHVLGPHVPVPISLLVATVWIVEPPGWLSHWSPSWFSKDKHSSGRRPGMLMRWPGSRISSPQDRRSRSSSSRRRTRTSSSASDDIADLEPLDPSFVLVTYRGGRTRTSARRRRRRPRKTPT